MYMYLNDKEMRKDFKVLYTVRISEKDEKGNNTGNCRFEDNCLLLTAENKQLAIENAFKSFNFPIIISQVIEV